MIDADGDGTISLQEWQAAQEKIFKAKDTDKDGTVSLEWQWDVNATEPVEVVSNRLPSHCPGVPINRHRLKELPVLTDIDPRRER